MTGHRSPESAYVDIFALSSKEFTSCFVKSLLIIHILCTSDILIFLLYIYIYILCIHKLSLLEIRWPTGSALTICMQVIFFMEQVGNLSSMRHLAAGCSHKSV